LFYESADEGATRIVLLVVVCASLTALNVLGTRHAIGSVGVLTVLKLLPLVALLLWGAPSIAAFVSPLHGAELPSSSATASALLLVLYAFVGFESALVPAGEAHHPARDIPRALLLTLAAVTALYVAIQAVCVGVVPDLPSTERPVVDAAAHLFGPVGTLLMTAGIVASVGGNVAGSMFSSPRMTYVLARDGHLPGWFADVHPVFRTPHWSIVGFGALVLALAIAGRFALLAAMSVLIRLLIYLVCIAALPSVHGDSATCRRRSACPAVTRFPRSRPCSVVGCCCR
jgi:amino acid transporter